MREKEWRKGEGEIGQLGGGGEPLDWRYGEAYGFDPHIGDSRIGGYRVS